MTSPEELLKLAMRRDADATEQLWRAINAGEGRVRDADLLEWVRAIAKKVVEEVIDADPRDRPAAALRAIGFLGRLGTHAELIAMFDIVERFDNLKDPGKELSRQQYVDLAREQGLFEGKSDAAARKVIDRVQKKRRGEV